MKIKLVNSDWQCAHIFQYICVSAISLVADYLIYYTLVVKAMISASAASVLGYSFGLIVAYVLIRNRVFKNGWLENQKKIEFLLFVLSGVLGMVLTYGTVRCVIDVTGDCVNLAKFFAVMVSFVVVYLFRKLVVFRNA